MKILLTNDWHFASRNPVSRTDDYNDELFTLLDQLAMVVEKLHVGAVCIAGDIFHDKGRAPWEVVTRLLQWADRVSLFANVYTIAGNHDEVADRLDSAPRTPYGVLLSSGLFKNLNLRPRAAGEGDDARAGDAWLYGVPWPNGGQPDAFDAIPAGVDVVVAHAYATPEGGEQWGQYGHRYDDLAVKAPHVKVWHFGHDHSDHGVVRLKNGAYVVNIGALCRGALDYDNLTRTVKVALVDTDTWAEPMQVALRVQPVELIFDLEKRAELKKESEELSKFVAQLASDVSTVFDVDYETIFSKMPLEADVRARVQDYISRAEAV